MFKVKIKESNLFEFPFLRLVIFLVNIYHIAISISSLKFIVVILLLVLVIPKKSFSNRN